MFNGARILVAPLDWGLGHAARDVPIIRRLLELDARPVIGADQGPLALLHDEFPQLPWVRIPGLEVRYSRSRSQRWSMARQFPAMMASVRAEAATFARIRADLELDAVISDQRFGIRCGDLPSVIVTHQVFPFTPLARGLLRRLNHSYLSRFDRCWIMDREQAPGLAGDLSHGRSMPGNARYIGTLSRMRPAGHARRHRIAAVISGPEPQRTLLERILVDHLRAIDGDHLLVLGQPGIGTERRVKNIRIVPHLDAGALEQAMCSADLIVSRSGYSTLMDLVAIGRPALIIPTPGQPEQEYLADLHQRTGRFIVQPQHAIDLLAALGRVAPLRSIAPERSDPVALEQALLELAGLIAR